jgi:hypothetical protein
MIAQNMTNGIDRFVEEQLFEEDVRAIVSMIRPNRRERLMGWHEYRTGGKHFRATISWDPQYAEQPTEEPISIPHLAEVLETIILGSVKSEAELPAADEFALYRGVVLELLKRLEEARSSCE